MGYEIIERKLYYQRRRTSWILYLNVLQPGLTYCSRGATLHQKVVVTGVGTYDERVEREPITGIWGQSPMWGVRGRSPPEAERFWQNNVKICTQIFHIYYIYARAGELLCRQKTSMTRLFGVREALNSTHWYGNFSLPIGVASSKRHINTRRLTLLESCVAASLPHLG